jgi:hypothetical protein
VLLQGKGGFVASIHVLLDCLAASPPTATLAETPDREPPPPATSTPSASSTAPTSAQAAAAGRAPASASAAAVRLDPGAALTAAEGLALLLAGPRELRMSVAAALKGGEPLRPAIACTTQAALLMRSWGRLASGAAASQGQRRRSRAVSH